MSLDVYLYEVTACESCGHLTPTRRVLYSANTTHNLNRMAQEAGIYEALWRPDEHGLTRAAQLVEPIRAGLALMKADPWRFKAFDSPNGWGLYEHFVPWIERYLAACVEHQTATVEVSR